MRPPPTGGTLPSETTLKAKKIKELIDKEESIGYVRRNDEEGDDEDDDEEDTSTSNDSGRRAIDATNIFAEGRRRPMTKKSKNALILQSIDKLTASNAASASALVSALSSFGGGGQGGGDGGVAGLRELEAKVDRLESTVKNLDSKIDSVMVELKTATQSILQNM